MFSRLSLSWRGILLAIAPLAVLSVLVVVLVVFLVQIQQAKSSELRSKEVLDQAHHLVKEELTKEIGSAAFVFQPEDLGGTAPSKIPITVRFSNFCDACVEAGQPASELVELRESAIRVAELMSIVQKNEREKQPMKDRPVLTKGILDEVAKIFHTLNLVRRFHTQRLDSETIHIQQLQDGILATLVIGLFGTLLLAALLVRLYATNIKKPLERIVENSRRLSIRDELLPTMAGSDEFSRLDEVVHAVDDAVGKALAREYSLINSAADLICSLDPDTCFSRVSPFSQQMLGISDSDLVGRSVFELIVPDDAPYAQNQLSLAMGGNAQATGGAAEPSSQFDLKLVRHDQSVVETRWSVLWSHRETKLFCVVHDITEDKIIERLRENFLTLVSQDLKAPLVSIQSSIRSILEVEHEPSPRVVKEVQTIERTMDVLVNQVNDLLEFQSVRAGTFELELQDCEIGPLIEETLTLVQAAAEAKNVRLETENGSWKVTADGAKVSRVLANFLSNAVRYAPPGTAVSINVTEQSDPGEPIEKRDSIEIAVVDEGPGVPPEFREKIFEAFEQVPGTKGGTGLGLAICKAMIEAHGGHVGVRDNVPSGSVFWMRLPRNVRPK